MGSCMSYHNGYELSTYMQSIGFIDWVIITVMDPWLHGLVAWCIEILSKTRVICRYNYQRVFLLSSCSRLAVIQKLTSRLHDLDLESLKINGGILILVGVYLIKG